MVSPVSDPELQGKGRPPSAAGDADPKRLEAAANSLSQEINAIWVAFTRSLDLQRRAVALRLFDTAWRAGVAALAAVVAVVAAAAATLLLVAGVRRGLATWTDNAWWSDLVLGGAMAAVLCIGLYSLQRTVHRNALKQIQRKLAPERPEQVPTP